MVTRIPAQVQLALQLRCWERVVSVPVCPFLHLSVRQRVLVRQIFLIKLTYGYYPGRPTPSELLNSLTGLSFSVSLLKPKAQALCVFISEHPFFSCLKLAHLNFISPQKSLKASFGNHQPTIPVTSSKCFILKVCLPPKLEKSVLSFS